VTCLNLGEAEVAKRKRRGLWSFALALVLALIFIVAKVPDVVRLLVWVPFFFGYLGLLQAHRKTCVVLAFQGKQNLDQGIVFLPDQTEASRLKRRSVGILLSSALLAAVCTVLTVAVHPERFG
jgi:hypothetical protein